MILGIFSLSRHEKLVPFPCLMSAIIHPGGKFQFVENLKEQCVVRSILFQLNSHRSEKNKTGLNKRKSYFDLQNSGSEAGLDIIPCCKICQVPMASHLSVI